MKKRPGRLDHHISAVGVDFSVVLGKRRIPVEEWPLHPIHLPSERPSLFRRRISSEERVDIGKLLFLLEDGKAETIDGGRALRVGHEQIGRFDSSFTSSLGLPPPLPAKMQLSSRGAVTDATFELDLEFVMPNGLLLRNYQLNGAFLRLGRHEYTLGPESYPLLVALEEWKRNPGTSPEERLTAFGKFKHALPKGARLGDGYLDELHIEFAPSFKLRIFRNDHGEADFDLEPCRWVQDEQSGELEATGFVPHSFLSPEELDRFSSTLRRRNRLLPAHPLGRGTILILGEDARRAMEVAHRIQKEPPEVREAFMRDPHRYLREAFEEDDFVEERLERTFWEDDLSDRIREIGIWQPPVLPWLRPAPMEWLPPRGCGLKFGTTEIEIPPNELERVAAKLEGALADGRPTIEYAGQEIPATEEALRAVERLVEAHRVEERPADVEDPAPGDEEYTPPRVLLIHDNFDDVRYEAPQRRQLEADARVPNLLLTELLPHQEEALQWLQEHFLVGNPGAILADDMGLGKTLTALAFLSWVRGLQLQERVVRRPTLLVAPAGLLPNWVEEHDRHLAAPGLGLPLVVDSRSMKELRIATGPDDPEKPVLDTKRLETSDWVLASYETVRDYQPSFARVAWGTVVLDEAQSIKNPAGRKLNAIASLRPSFRLAMTGTPVENRLADLWSIADFAWPSRLGDLRSFSQQFEDADPALLQELAHELMVDRPPPFMKRRMKTDHLDGLPPKQSRQWKETMPALQAEQYSLEVEGARASEEPGKMLIALHKFRRISLAPLSWLEAGADDEAWIRSSARLMALFKILDHVRDADERALVFLEEKEVQADLRGVLQRRYGLSRPPMVINGDLAGSGRQKRVATFQEERGFDVMLLSPKAAGVGLTLTSANHVVHLSRWWNPAVEDQCSDRVYRIGQERPVHLHYPLAIHPEYGEQSFDLLLDALLERKRALSRRVLSPAAILHKQDGEELFHQATRQGS